MHQLLLYFLQPKNLLLGFLDVHETLIGAASPHKQLTYEHDDSELGPEFEDISVKNYAITVGVISKLSKRKKERVINLTWILNDFMF